MEKTDERKSMLPIPPEEKALLKQHLTESARILRKYTEQRNRRTLKHRSRSQNPDARNCGVPNLQCSESVDKTNCNSCADNVLEKCSTGLKHYPF
jgi:hypothetical protein